MLEILFQDESLVAVNKPAGLLVHRSDIDRHETRFALQLLREQLGRRVYPLHRLDKPTSGVLLFALDPGLVPHLSAAFAAGEVTKSYLAVVRGITDSAGQIDHPLGEVRDRMINSTGAARPLQPAVTDYRRLASAELPVAMGPHPTCRYTLVEASPLTGRRHQLRRHFKHILHPLIGDTTYGEGRHNRLFRERFGCTRLLLHAAELVFTQPRSGERIAVTAPLDQEFAALIRQLGWQDALHASRLP